MPIGHHRYYTQKQTQHVRFVHGCAQTYKHVCVCICVFGNHKEAINLRFGGSHGRNWKERDWEELEERMGERK